MSEHTPGPWELHDKVTMQVIANYREEIKRLRMLNTELLEACKEALRDIVESNGLHSLSGKTLKILDGAIAKSEGEHSC